MDFKSRLREQLGVRDTRYPCIRDHWVLGIIDDIVHKVVLDYIIKQLVILVPWLGYGWASGILAALISYIIKPLFEKVQEKFNFMIIDWQTIEQDRDYQKERDRLKEVIEKIQDGTLSPNDKEVIDAKESYTDKLSDLISMDIS